MANNDIAICRTDGEIVSHGVPITKEKFEELNVQLTKDTLLYLDENNELQIRDRLTKYDAKTAKWIPDTDAITMEKRQKLVNEALQQLNATDSWGMDDRCEDSPKEQVTAMRDYRKQLRSIIRGTLNVDSLPEIPEF